MEKINGSAIRNQVQSLREDNSTEPPSIAPRMPQEPPAKEFVQGRVLTRVWANPNHWGEITWRVDQLRFRSGNSTTSNVARSFHLDDLQDAMRGLYQAKQWIRRTERRRRWRFLSWKRW